MEYSLTEDNNSEIVINVCLNPYSNGILPDIKSCYKKVVKIVS